MELKDWKNEKSSTHPGTENVSHTIATKGIHDVVLLTCSVDLGWYNSGVHPSLCGEYTFFLLDVNVSISEKVKINQS